MAEDQNKALARRALELWSSGKLSDDLSAVDEIYAPTYVNHQHHHPDSPDAVRGTEEWKRFMSDFHRAFPDFLDTIDDQIAEGDRVVTRFTSRGTQQGEIMGIPPTGKQASWTGIEIDRIEDGKIVESWVNWDMMGMLQQLGAVSLSS